MAKQEMFDMTEWARLAPWWKFWDKTQIAHVYCTYDCDFYFHVYQPMTDEQYEFMELKLMHHERTCKFKPKKKSTKK